ncbi:MAG TPA: YhjD/YihY/BrkB family envelope integrity protein, partial [Thermoleophilaceae bacterium]|nr:YhjD/YihY/BrkB family envelope integrity protein [Thermoleophilaceae bacterium]
LSARIEALSRRGREWSERQDPGSRSGLAISAWRHYRAIDAPLQSALLSLYMLVAVLPAVLVMEEYLDPHPDSLANSLVHHFHLNAPTATLIHGVLDEGKAHELGSALLAVAGALFFGLGFGRVLQLVHARSWQLALPTRRTDQALYAAVLIGLYGLILLLLVQVSELKGSPRWVEAALALGWAGLLVLFFVWAPWLLTHKLIKRRDLLPGAALTAVGVVVLMLVSRYVMQFWVDLYARDYGGLGVVLAIYFWIAFSSALIVGTASLSPALADRRNLPRRL